MEVTIMQKCKAYGGYHQSIIFYLKKKREKVSDRFIDLRKSLRDCNVIVFDTDGLEAGYSPTISQ